MGFEALRGRRVLVTGHTGFKGSWLSAWLVALGAEVTGLSLGVPTEPALFDMMGLRDAVRHLDGDVRDAAAVREAVRVARPEVVLHLAAQPVVSVSYEDPLTTFSTNVMGTVTLAAALTERAEPCAAVFVTSDKCYENVEWVWGYRETDRLGGKDVYSASKAAAEIALHAWRHSFLPSGHAVRMATARAGNVIGGGDWAKDRIVADCIRAWQAGRRVPVRSPRATRPWQHVLEPLSGYLVLACGLLGAVDAGGTSPLHGEAFNFGPHEARSVPVLEVLHRLATAYGHPDPADAHEVVGDVPFHEAGLLRLDCAKAQQVLAWRGVLTHDEAVALTGTWYRQALDAGPAQVRALTLGQIDRYTDLAADRGAAWAVGARRPVAV